MPGSNEDVLICDKNVLFKNGDALPACTRPAEYVLEATDRRTRRQATAYACSTCHSMIMMRPHLVDLISRPLEEGS